MAPSRVAARRAVEAALARAGDALTAGVEAVTGRRSRPQPAVDAATAPARGVPADEAAAAAKQSPPAEPLRPAASGEQAAARIDAARERLRARIAPPADEDPPPPPA